MPITQLLETPHKFSDDYKNTVFMIWWKHSKPTVLKLKNLIPTDPETGITPSEPTLRLWIKDYFIPKSAEMDQEFYDQVQEISIQEKVEMLQRHSATAVTMQELAKNWIIEHGDQLTMSSAIRLLIEGVRIERDSKGIPDALQKMSELSDDELLDEVKQILSESGGDFLPNDIE